MQSIMQLILRPSVLLFSLYKFQQIFQAVSGLINDQRAVRTHVPCPLRGQRPVTWTAPPPPNPHFSHLYAVQILLFTMSINYDSHFELIVCVVLFILTWWEVVVMQFVVNKNCKNTSTRPLEGVHLQSAFTKRAATSHAFKTLLTNVIWI